VLPGEEVTATRLESLREAVNLVRNAAGWPGLMWENMLTAADPLVTAGSKTYARHVVACRERMNEALQALGAPVVSYQGADLVLQSILAEHVNDVLDRTK
jgi:hypothetical protein